MSSRFLTGVARVSSALAAAGAYDASPTAIPVNGFDEITFLIRYTRGGAGGAFAYTIEFSNDKTNWYQTAEITSGTFAAGADATDDTQRVSNVYEATGAGAEGVTTPTYKVIANFCRINGHETGAVGTPGTLVVEYTLAGGV